MKKNILILSIFSLFFSSNFLILSGGRTNKWEKDNVNKNYFKCIHCQKTFGSRDAYVGHFVDIFIDREVKIEDVLCGPKIFLENCRICNNKINPKVTTEAEHIYRVHVRNYNHNKPEVVINKLNLVHCGVTLDKEEIEVAQILLDLSRQKNKKPKLN